MVCSSCGLGWLFHNWTCKPKNVEDAIVISCHYRIEDWKGYEKYKQAKQRGDGTVLVRFLGDGNTSYLSTDSLDPSRFEK